MIVGYLLSRKAKERWSPIDWSPVDRALLLIFGQYLLGALFFLAVHLLLKYYSDHFTYANWDFFRPGHLILNLYATVITLLLVIGLWLRNRIHDCRLFTYCVVLSTAVCCGFTVYAFGAATYPNSWVLSLTIGAFVLLLFDLKQAFWWLGIFLIVIIGTTYSTKLILIPYAPIISTSPFSGDKIDMLYLGYSLGFGLLVFILAFSIIAMIVVRWRNREEELATMARELNQSLEALRQTQGQLVEAEKMAALGGLVAGVAHEVNTPVGVAVTAASHLQEKTVRLKEAYTAGDMKRSELETFLDTGIEVADMILANLSRAANLVQSFKQVAVDQTSEERRKFKLKKYIDDVLLSLRPRIKKTRIMVTVDGPDDLELTGYPGAISQIITNLVLNSLVHGFAEGEEGKIEIEVAQEGEKVRLSYSDNGGGMTEEQVKKLFEPFFTTKRGQGGSGLGMHVVYNLVTRTLGGRIVCKSSPGEGTVFTINIPRTGVEDDRPQ